MWSIFNDFSLYCRNDAESTDYWGSSIPSSARVHVMPAQNDDTVFLSDSITSSQVVLMNGDEALSLEDQADMVRANKDKFKCLYLLVETAIAMRGKNGNDDVLIVTAE